MNNRHRFLSLLILGTVAPSAIAKPQQEVVGPLPKTGQPSNALVATRQTIRPVGRTIEYQGRPVDLVLSPNRKYLYVKDNQGIVVMDCEKGKHLQTLAMPDGTSMHGIVLNANGSRLYVTDAASKLFEGTIDQTSGTVKWSRQIKLPEKKGKAYGCGIALHPDGKRALVCLSRNNSLATINLQTGAVTAEIPVGIAPYDVALSADGKTAWVSDWGGRRPKAGERTADSGGTETLIDERGVGSSGCVSLVDLNRKKEIIQIKTGLHPSDILLTRDGKKLYTANANSDTVTVIDTISRKATQTISVHADARLLFGSAPTGLAFSPDEKTLYVTCAGNNAVAVISLAATAPPRLTGLIPAGWYPGAIVTDKANGTLHIANVKGIGSRTEGGVPGGKGWNVYAFRGTVQSVAPPTPTLLKQYTTQARTDALLPDALRMAERRDRQAATGKKPVPVPEAIGDPSVFEHVVYILKENRTYDQVFGDLKQGNGDASLCIFGRKITPNHHALAEEFVLLDNFYCNGVLSADGHSWATEGNVTDHLEKSFGGFTRSYTFGDDPLTYSSSGFLWDNVLAHGLTFYNYGEMDYADTNPKGEKFAAVYKDYFEGEKRLTFTHKIGVDNLRRYSHPDFPGWNTSIPDVIRADIFLKDLARCEKEGRFPHLTLIYLPNDHTGGDVSAESYLADNDLALGRVVEGISKSSFWSKTCIFVVEDDPQSGWDHVDGHRSPCLVISPYTKRGAVVSRFYNQTSVLHTMERILGLPPMNQMDAMSPFMGACFTSTLDLRPYTAKPNGVSIADTSRTLNTLAKKSKQIATLRRRVRFDKPDSGDDDAMNRILWYAMKGKTTNYPAHLAGASNGEGEKDDDD